MAPYVPSQLGIAGWITESSHLFVVTLLIVCSTLFHYDDLFSYHHFHSYLLGLVIGLSLVLAIYFVAHRRQEVRLQGAIEMDKVIRPTLS